MAARAISRVYSRNSRLFRREMTIACVTFISPEFIVCRFYYWKCRTGNQRSDRHIMLISSRVFFFSRYTRMSIHHRIRVVQVAGDNGNRICEYPRGIDTLKSVGYVKEFIHIINWQIRARAHTDLYKLLSIFFLFLQLIIFSDSNTSRWCITFAGSFANLLYATDVSIITNLLYLRAIMQYSILCNNQRALNNEILMLKYLQHALKERFCSIITAIMNLKKFESGGKNRIKKI